MARRRRNRFKIHENVRVEKMAAEGKAMAHLEDGKVLFIENALPGELVNIQITRNKKDYAVGKAVKIIETVPERQEAFCQHFGTCGGCKWQYLDYPKQAAYKQAIVEEAFQRVGKLDFPPLLPILAAKTTTYYRNKLEYTFAKKRWLTAEEIASSEKIENRGGLGFHMPGAFDKIINIQHCYLQAAPSNDLRNAIRDYATEQAFSFYDVIEQEGFLRNLIIRYTSLEELMVIVVFGHEEVQQRTALLDFVSEKFPQITSLHYVINEKKNDTIFDLEVHTHNGRGHIFEELEDIRYKISPKSFFQTNSEQALRLYQVVRDFANLQGDEILYDLYGGTGGIALFLAKKCQKVVGIEEIEAATLDAHFNASLNQIANAHFFTGDVRKLLDNTFLKENGQPDILITDPPRAGMHADVVKKILEIAPERIIYVSCNPVTQARDLQLMASHYQIEKAQPVDLFPHTYHIENVVLLTRIQPDALKGVSVLSSVR